jgi:replicative DNA helicase
VTRAEDVFRKLGGKKHASGYLVPCVAHEDRNPSLSISDGEGGRLLWSCKAGCSQDAVRAGLERHGFELRDTREQPRERAPEIVYVVRDASGKAIAQHVRVDKPDGKIVFWRGPAGEKVKLAELGLRLADLPLYCTEFLGYATPEDVVVITEGEKACDAARRIGLLGLGTVTGASSAPSEQALAPLKACGRVVLWPDNDDEGRKHMSRIAHTLAKLGVKTQVLTWPGAPPKGDAADFVAAGKTRADFDALVAPPRTNLRRLDEGIRGAIEELDRFTSGDFSDRVPTGITDLDERLNGGLRHGQVTLVGAPTGGGKTTFVQQVAAHAARTRGGVILASPEQGVDELAEREIIRHARRSRLERNPWRRPGPARDACVAAHALSASRLLEERLPIYVFDETGATMASIEAAAEQVENLKLVVIDYAQEVAEDDPRKPRHLQVADVARSSVALARKFRVPVLVASQVNVVETKSGRGGPRRDYVFRETAVLEQKAHTVLILEVDRELAGGVNVIKAARVICKKQRGAATFVLPVYYDPAIYEIGNKAEPDTPTESRGTLKLDLEPPQVPR